MTLGFMLALPLFIVPALAASGPEAQERAAHHHLVDFAKAKALVSPAAPAARAPEIDGLSRNPDDCNYGCIDNGN